MSDIFTVVVVVSLLTVTFISDFVKTGKVTDTHTIVRNGIKTPNPVSRLQRLRVKKRHVQVQMALLSASVSPETGLR